jgi:hypothetical protein
MRVWLNAELQISCIFALWKRVKNEKKTWKVISQLYKVNTEQNINNILLINMTQRVLKFTFVLVLTYYVNDSLEGAPHLFVILTAIGWSIVNIQSDLFWHWCLERQTFGTHRMYTLSPSKSIKRSNYREFLKDKDLIYDILDCFQMGKLENSSKSFRIYTIIRQSSR